MNEKGKEWRVGSLDLLVGNLLLGLWIEGWRYEWFVELYS